MVEEVLNYWFGATLSAVEVNAQKRALWWGKAEESDREIRTRFGACQVEAAAGGLVDWEAEPRSLLALILVLDQFSRVIHRGNPAGLACDARALLLAKQAIRLDFSGRLRPIERIFLYLPLEHSESLADQQECVALFETLLAEAPAADRAVFEGSYRFAIAHLEIVARFQRFPHRNEVLGRTSTPAEVEFLKEPNSGF